MNKAIIEKFIDFCNTNFDIAGFKPAPKFKSLSMCVIDCVYSLRAQYFSTTVPVDKRYAAKYMNNDMYAAGDTLSNLMSNIDNTGGFHDFAANVLQNLQKGSGGRLKSEICYEIARKLSVLIHIDSLEDFQNFESDELIEIVLRSIKGIGDAAVNYLFMLAGDPNRCKPDTHINHCIYDACGHYVSNQECQEIFTAAIAKLNETYPNLTVRDLDNIIWNKYQRNR